ncbi:adhesion G protein-coupled receptor E2-like isoform X3 [Biomphalaria glabrata]|uniref:Adhesion G protein-coupled receptor E2-like isoform X3 n=1 Tax=Biomphalaria glabrata TaxID=6526 RepID=A0A9W3AA18_BIOGL|nr:adhesion G protein-coupled receptor E2-like isoform X3 [Biomphalaria glabrata]
MEVDILLKTLSTLVILISSVPETCSELLVTPYPARIYKNAPRDVPVLKVEFTSNSTTLSTTTLALDRKSDARYFRLGPDGVLYTNETINLQSGTVLTFFVFAIYNSSADYKQIRIIVSNLNKYAPQFNQSAYTFPVYRYGAGDVIGQLTVTDEDEDDYNSQFTIYVPNLPENQEAIKHVSVSPTGQISLTQNVPADISVLNFTVVAEDAGSPQLSSTAEVKIDILMVKQPDIFCISTTSSTTSLCWKNPMPGVQFEGYDIMVESSFKENVFLPSVEPLVESCFILNNTRIGGQYVFHVKVRSNDVWYGVESYLAFNKTATGYTYDCVKNQFFVCNYKNPCNGNGACNPVTTPDSYSCNCSPGWRGDNCTIKDWCAYSPCKNGTCTFLEHNKYECSCSEGFFGNNCQYYNACLDAPCANQGSCTINQYGVYTCQCLPGFSGKDCLTVDPCFPSPCAAGRGSCKRLSNTDFDCQCYSGYYGNLCQYVDACSAESSPCMYFGTCVSVNDTYFCVCPPGTSGQRCEKQDPCFLQPCKNNGQCIAGDTGSFTCDCPEGYTGNECQQYDACHNVNCRNGTCKPVTGSLFKCECNAGYYGDPFCTNYDACLTLPCKNRGQCLSFDGNNKTEDTDYKPFYNCTCLLGWYGQNCTFVDQCLSQPCKNGGSCNLEPPNGYNCACRPGYSLDDCSKFDPCYSQPCQNDGQCLPDKQETSYSCKCKPGFILSDCSQADPCYSSGKCKNGGTCVTQSDGGYSCDCLPGYSSHDCSLVVPCYVNECQNGGLCTNLSLTEFKCDCPAEWIGSRCDISATCLEDKEGCVCVNKRLQCLMTSGNVSQRLNNLLDQTSDPSKLTAKQVIFFTEALWDLYNETVINISYATIAFNVIGNLGRVNTSVSYEAEKVSSTNTKLRLFLDNFTSEVNLTEKGEVTVPTKDFELKAMLLETVKEHQNYTFEVELNFNQTEAIPAHNVSIALPTSAVSDSNNSSSGDIRLQFIGYKRSQLFVPIEGFDQLGTIASQYLGHQRVISATVKGRELYNLTDPVIIQIPKIQAGVNHTCVFWDTTASTWSTEGVTQFEDDLDMVICHSNHLTSFAVLMDTSPAQRFSKVHEDALTYITYIGCGISLACLFLTVLTYCLFRCLNKEKSGKILIQLGFSLIFLNIIFLVGSVDVSGYSNVGCVVVALLLHYFILGAFMWMLIEAIEMYQALVTVFSKYEGYYLLKRCIAAWGVPLLIVGITAAVDIYSYHNDQEPREICFLTSQNAAAYYSALIAPCCLIILINTVVFIMVSRVILKPKFQQQLTTETVTITPAQIRGAFTVMFLLGITWVFGPLAINEAKLVFSYIFCICNSLQGFLIFVFRCLFNPEAKLAWIQLFKTGTLKRRRGPYKSSNSDYTSKAVDNRFQSNSNGSGFSGQMSTKMSLAIKSGNGCHPHPHQLHTTSSWHPNLNGTKSDKVGNTSHGANFPLGSKKDRRESMDYSVDTKRESIPNDSMSEFQDELTHF